MNCELSMKRRAMLKAGVGAFMATPLLAAIQRERFGDAAEVLAKATASGEIESAVLHVNRRQTVFAHAFGKAGSTDAMFPAASPCNSRR